MTGGGKEAYVLADKMSEAWIQFARTGNPNHKAYPYGLCKLPKMEQQ